jgi:hypothetical protein
LNGPSSRKSRRISGQASAPVAQGLHEGDFLRSNRFSPSRLVQNTKKFFDNPVALDEGAVVTTMERQKTLSAAAAATALPPGCGPQTSCRVIAPSKMNRVRRDDDGHKRQGKERLKGQRSSAAAGQVNAH